MVNNYNKSSEENELAKMKHLIGFGLNEEKTNKGNASVAFHQVGADGKTYAIVNECNKFYIKVAPKKDTEILAEDYDYIGGFMNKKDYEYPTYTMASKQFGLKMKSLNEAFASKKNKPVVMDKPIESAEWQVNETKEMRSELNRFNQIMNNVDYILSEGKEMEGKALQLGTKSIDKEGGNAFQEKPYTENQWNGMKENQTNPKDADDTFSETPMSQDSINKMKETSRDPKKADDTYSRKPKTLKLTNEQAEKVLAWNDCEDYIDTTHGTEIGDNAPFTDNVNEEVEIDGDTGLPEENDGQLLTDDNEMSDNYDYQLDLYGDEPIDDEPTDEYEPFEYDEDNPDGVLDFETRDDMDQVLESVIRRVIRRRMNEGYENDEPEFDPNIDNGYDYETRGPEDDFGYSDNMVEDDFLEEPEEEMGSDGMDEMLESVVSRVVDRKINENTLDVFGKHPAWQKSPMTLPSNSEPSRFGRSWDDNSVNGEQPYGTQIGHNGDPYTEKVIDMLTDSVMDKLMSSIGGAKKKV